VTELLVTPKRTLLARPLAEGASAERTPRGRARGIERRNDRARRDRLCMYVRVRACVRAEEKGERRGRRAREERRERERERERERSVRMRRGTRAKGLEKGGAGESTTSQ